jgi:hypothetical protein
MMVRVMALVLAERQGKPVGKPRWKAVLLALVVQAEAEVEVVVVALAQQQVVALSRLTHRFVAGMVE